MRRINLVRKLIKMSLEESLMRVDPTGKIKLSEFSVVSPSDLIIQGLLEGFHLVGFAIGDCPELIIAFDFEDSSSVIARLLKLNKIETLEAYNIEEFVDSLLREMGNVIAGQFASWLSNFLGEDLLPSPPFSIKTVTQLERILSHLDGGMGVPVFVGVVDGGMEGKMKVYIIPSPDFIKKIEGDPSIRRRLSNKNSHFRRRREYVR